MENLLFLQKINKSEQIEFVKQARHGNKAAKDKLVLSCVGMIKKRIMQLVNENTWCYPLLNTVYEDLLNTGVLGVLYALEKFDISRNTSFSSYAFFWVDASLKKQFEIMRKTHYSRAQNAFYENVTDDERETMFDEAFSKVLCKQLLSVVENIEREIIILFFGFGCRCHTLTEISKKYGLSISRVSRVKQQALQKMRNSCNCALKCA